MKLEFRSLEARIVFHGEDLFKITQDNFHPDHLLVQQEAQTNSIHQIPFETAASASASGPYNHSGSIRHDQQEQRTAAFLDIPREIPLDQYNLVSSTQNPSFLSMPSERPLPPYTLDLGTRNLMRNDSYVVELSISNAFHMQGLFYLQDIHNPHFNTLVMKIDPNFDSFLNSSDFHATIIQSNFGPTHFSALYPDYQNTIPIIIGANFFSYPSNTIQVATQVMDTILHQASQIILPEIQQIRPVRVEFFMQTESIFSYSQELQRQNISQLHYQIISQHSNTDSGGFDFLTFNFFITEVHNRTNQIHNIKSREALNQEEQELLSQSNDPICGAESSTRYRKELIACKKGDAYHARSLFYRCNLNHPFLNNLLIENFLEAPNPSIQHNSLYSARIPSGLGSVQFSSLYQEYRQPIPIYIENNFLFYQIQNIDIAIHVIDTMLHASSEIVLSKIKQIKSARVEFLIRTESIFSNVQKVLAENISQLHYQIVPHHVHDDQAGLDVLRFYFCFTKIENS